MNLVHEIVKYVQETCILKLVGGEQENKKIGKNSTGKISCGEQENNEKALKKKTAGLGTDSRIAMNVVSYCSIIVKMCNDENSLDVL